MSHDSSSFIDQKIELPIKEMNKVSNRIESNLREIPDRPENMPFILLQNVLNTLVDPMKKNHIGFNFSVQTNRPELYNGLFNHQTEKTS